MHAFPFRSRAKACSIQRYADIRQGIETLKRTNQLVNDFETKIKERTENGVQIVKKPWKPSTTASAAAEARLSFGTGLPADEPRHDWISVMVKFRKAMYSIHKLLPGGVVPQRIKVRVFFGKPEIKLRFH